MDMDRYAPWQGYSETHTERLDLWPVRGLLAALDSTEAPTEGQEVPPLAQWLYFPPMVVQSDLGDDGHPRRGGFLPPITLARRMWAASDIRFHAPLVLGKHVTKTATVSDISLKEGKSGALIFVKLDNTYSDSKNGAPLLEETQTLVYRDLPGADEPAPAGKPAPEGAAWSRAYTIDEAMMFRYSAVTFNAHRIHYDREYTRAQEGYPDILVQGQLSATLMLRDLLTAVPDARLASFSFRGVQPVLCGERVHVEGKPREDGGYDLWVRDNEGILRVSGRAG